MPCKIQVTLPNRIGDDLQKWAAYDGEPLANLGNFLLERAVLEAKGSCLLRTGYINQRNCEGTTASFFSPSLSCD